MINKNLSTAGRIIWITYTILFIVAGSTAVIMDKWTGYAYMVLLCIAVFLYDFKIVKGKWMQYIPLLLTIIYLLFEHEPILLIWRKIFN